LSQKRVQKGKPGTVTDGGPLSRISVFFVIFGDLMLRLTKLLLKSVLAFFYGKSSIFQFIRTLLSMRWFSMHQSLNEPPFVTAVLFNGRYTSAVTDDNKKDYEHCAIGFLNFAVSWWLIRAVDNKSRRGHFSSERYTNRFFVAHQVKIILVLAEFFVSRADLCALIIAIGW